jgi:Cft2 family RNA processing exonuclease
MFAYSVNSVAPRVDALLLSHADIRHLGAYPYALAHLGLNCPVYGTLPMQYMGRLELRDIYLSRRDVEDFKLFTIDDIEAAFNRIITLKHSQPVQLEGTCVYISVTATATYVDIRKMPGYYSGRLYGRPYDRRCFVENLQKYRGDCLCSRL